MYKVDAAFGEVMTKADGQLKAWRQVVGAGKIVSDFGERVRRRGGAGYCGEAAQSSISWQGGSPRS